MVPKQNPEVFFRQVMQQNQAQPQANPGQGESGGKVIDFNNQQKPVSPTPSESQSGSLGNRKGGS